MKHNAALYAKRLQQQREKKNKGAKRTKKKRKRKKHEQKRKNKGCCAVLITRHARIKYGKKRLEGRKISNPCAMLCCETSTRVLNSIKLFSYFENLRSLYRVFTSSFIFLPLPRLAFLQLYHLRRSAISFKYNFLLL